MPTRAPARGGTLPPRAAQSPAVSQPDPPPRRRSRGARGKLFVVYCAGPHCNGADKAALNLASLGRPVKKMIGGVAGWLDEGFTLVDGAR